MTVGVLCCVVELGSVVTGYWPLFVLSTVWVVPWLFCWVGPLLLALFDPLVVGLLFPNSAALSS